MINIGVVGTGSNADRHLKAYAGDDCATLVAVADVDEDRAQTAAGARGVARAYRGPAELLADPQVDAVSICTPNVTHAALVTQAIQAGKHSQAAGGGAASDVEDLANAMIRFDNGASMILETSYSLHARRTRSTCRSTATGAEPSSNLFASPSSATTPSWT